MRQPAGPIEIRGVKPLLSPKSSQLLLRNSKQYDYHLGSAVALGVLLVHGVSP
jgi:hypothetical protein